MSIIKHLLYIFCTVTLLAIAISCNNDGCEGNSNSLPLAGFYSSQTKSAIALDSLTIYGIGMKGDTTIIKNAKSVKQSYLPFNMSDTISRFVIRYEQQTFVANNITDTITITYDNIPFFHSEDCGAMYIYKINSYNTTNALIDSIAVLAETIDNTDKENIKIYFRTEADNE